MQKSSGKSTILADDPWNQSGIIWTFRKSYAKSTFFNLIAWVCLEMLSFKQNTEAPLSLGLYSIGTVTWQSLSLVSDLVEAEDSMSALKTVNKNTVTEVGPHYQWWGGWTNRPQFCKRDYYITIKNFDWNIYTELIKCTYQKLLLVVWMNDLIFVKLPSTVIQCHAPFPHCPSWDIRELLFIMITRTQKSWH